MVCTVWGLQGRAEVHARAVWEHPGAVRERFGKLSKLSKSYSRNPCHNSTCGTDGSTVFSNRDAMFPFEQQGPQPTTPPSRRGG